MGKIAVLSWMGIRRVGGLGKFRPASRRAALLTASNFYRLFTQMAMIPVLARLVSPAEFGQVGMIMPIVLAVTIIGELGLGAALVRSKFAGDVLESTVWWLCLMVGAGFALSFLLGAPFLAAMFAGAVPLPVFWWLSPVLLLSCMGTVPTARLQRENRVVAFAVGDIVSSTVSAILALAMAWRGFGVYALVGQQLAIWSSKLLILSVSARFVPRLTFDRRLLRGALRFALPLSGANLLDYWSRAVDNVVVGRFLGAHVLGLYSLSYQLMRIPDAIISGPIAFTVFPSIDRMDNDHRRIAETYESLIEILLTLASPLLFGLSAVATQVVLVFLGPKWHEAAMLLTIIAPAGILQCLVPASFAILMGTGNSLQQLMLAVLQVFAILFALTLGLSHGAIAVTAAVLVASIGSNCVTIITTARLIQAPARRLLVAASRPIVAGALMWMAVRAAQHEVHLASAAAQLAASVVLGGAVYLLLAVPQVRRAIAMLRPQAG